MSSTPERHAKIKRIFLEINTLSESERTVYLDQICNDDPELRGELEELLKYHDREDFETKATFQTSHIEGLGPPSTRSMAYPVPVIKDPLEETDHDLVPGKIIGGRYRIVAQVGRGGMGAVYRADDLKLGLPVALKFMSSGMRMNQDWLERLHQEVCIARTVTHPNVCRVFDIGESEGVHFISMEYIDGENLGTLLKRIGRLPPGKVLDVTKQLCAGLAAAHGQAVLHRDLKPANIMLDGRGQVRITDFGLAAVVGHVRRDEIRAGTPGYMAPEQMSGQEVSVQSDLYALGLVLYEMILGQPAHTRGDGAGDVPFKDGATFILPTELVEDIDPDVERSILLCLEKLPENRPTSANAIMAMLPGGDLLDEAMAMGRTPSPNTVAAAYGEWRERPSFGILSFLLFVAFMAAMVFVADRWPSASISNMKKSPDVLAQNARDMLARLGWLPESADYAYAYTVETKPPISIQVSKDRIKRAGIPEMARGNSPLFWYRQSSVPMTPVGVRTHLFQDAMVGLSDPPMNRPGMTTLILDQRGRLVFFEATGPEMESTATRQVNPTDLLELAGLNQANLLPSEVFLIPPNVVDTHAAWSGIRDDEPDVPLHAEIMLNNGGSVFFAAMKFTEGLSAPWYIRPEGRRVIAEKARIFLAIALLFAAIPLARRHLKQGQSDRLGAKRLAALIVALRLLQWLLRARHVPDFNNELLMVYLAVLRALGEGAFVWLLYVALEPYARRFWPHTLVSWTRLLSARFLNPLIGRDLLVGATLGAFLGFIIYADTPFVNYLGFRQRPEVRLVDHLSPLLGPRYSVAMVLQILGSSIYQGLIFGLLIAILRAVVKNSWFAAIIAIVLISPSYMPLGAHQAVAWMTIGLACVGPIVFATIRFGLLTVMTALFCATNLVRFPITMDHRVWYWDMSFLAVLTVFSIAIYGFWGLRKNLPIPSPS